MKKIINGKKYDTETAERIGVYQSRENRHDFNCIVETLYRKRTTGEFFLYGEGGPQTKYAKLVDQNWWSGSAEIIPFNDDKARAWAEKYLDGDRYEEIFGEVDE
ncbi:MAG: hypothetical protein LUC32_06090 [Clostridiales bacterium]|nr:hypothetical protein [Clostridiales bacterium]